MTNFEELLWKTGESEIFPKLSEFSDKLTDENKKQIAKSELLYFEKKIDKIDKEIQKLMKKKGKIEKEFFLLEENLGDQLIWEMEFEVKSIEKLEQINNISYEIELNFKFKKELMKIKKERRNILVNFLKISK